MSLSQPPLTKSHQHLAQTKTEVTLPANLEQANKAHLSGNFQLAQAMYESIIKESPKTSVALHSLGVIKIQAGAYKEAISLIKKSLKEDPIQCNAQSNLAHCYNALGRPKDAKFHAAIAINLDPQNPNPRINKGLAHLATKEFEDASACFKEALALNSNSLEAAYNLGLLHTETQDFSTAKIWFQKAERIAPLNSAVQHNLGITFDKLAEYSTAEAYLKKAMDLEPENIQFRISFATLLIKLGKHHVALDLLSSIFSKQPNHAVALYIAARIHRNLGDLLRAADFCKAAFASDSSHHRAHFNESIFRLTLGEFVKGWDAYKSRWKIDLYGKPPRLKRPYWNGEPLTSTLMVWGEQGLGDEILHFSLLREVQERVAQVIVYTDKRLIPLLARSFPGVEFRERTASIPERDFKKWICSGDLGGVFRRSWESFEHQPSPYLATDPLLTHKIRDRLRSDKKFICGLSWTSKSKEHEFRKSLRVADLVPILKTPGFDFVDISYVDSENDREEALRSSGTCLNRIKEIDHFNDIDRWSSVIDACDVVITVSNTTAHIAGGLGKKTVVLLPFSEGSLWYWHQGQRRSVWYPKTTLLRQQSAGDWALPVNESIDILNNLLNEKN